MQNPARSGLMGSAWKPIQMKVSKRNLNFILISVLMFSISWPGAHGASEAKRAAFLKAIERPKVPLNPTTRTLPETNGLTQIHFTFASESQERVTGLLLKRSRSQGRRPVVIVLHGTGSNKEAQLSHLQELAKKDFAAVSIDGRYHGERSRSGRGNDEYLEAIVRRYRTGQERPFLYDTVWDVLRLIDYLETRDDVDAKRIGVIGFSKGGMETYLAAAVDSRIAVAVPCIGVQSFRWALDNNAWQSRVQSIQNAVNAAAKDAGVTAIDAAFVRKFYDSVVPGIYGEFDGPAMLPLIAPRPLLVINGDSDARTPLPGVQECAEAARLAYASAAAKDRFDLLIQEKTGHQVTVESLRTAVDWFVRWLNP
ncbi:MAG: abhydrolase domain-containing 18 [Verrucomicrobia bacterium]|nr:abhydrolase domain-containing 18 [Verrucomicrobiota bacterium]